MRLFSLFTSFFSNLLDKNIIFNKIKKFSARIFSKVPYLKALFLVFLLIALTTRLGLLIFNGDFSLLLPQYSLPILALGLLYDFSAFIYWAIPYILILTLVPVSITAKTQKIPIKKYLAHILAFILIMNWVLIAASEFTFWHEFNSRFNFIAVDYLIYTSEVLGNIRESYNLPLLLSGVVVIGLIFFEIYRRLAKKEDLKSPPQHVTHITHVTYVNSISQIKNNANNHENNNVDKGKGKNNPKNNPKNTPQKITEKMTAFGKQTLALFAVILFIPLLNYLSIQAPWANFSQNREANELALNGHFAFGHAFFANQIDYAQFYPKIPQPMAKQILAAAFKNDTNQPWVRASRSKNLSENLSENLSPAAPSSPPAPPLNVVLISIESMSADFLKAYGNQENITPFLDGIKDQSLWFKQLYATGTRTVRGLEALSMSIPPTPGHSIVKRNHNEGLATMGDVLGRSDANYQSSFIYGGYGAFDNMNYYFKNSGYQTIDRTELNASRIHYENIWGVADEDLFTLALQSLDKQSQTSNNQPAKPFFAHIMTTSNHRPFTYPEGRIDIPSKTNRQGAVKYTDWAIGDFFKRASSKPWFKNTIFVIVADHCASARGKTDLPIDKFLIPLFVYAPAVDLAKYPQLKPRVIDKVASQIDIAPTILALINQNLPIKFFGQNILNADFKERAFMANYQTVGMLQDGQMVELRPQQIWRLLDATTNQVLKQGTLKKAEDLAKTPDVVKTAIAYYQSASQAYKDGDLRAEAKNK